MAFHHSQRKKDKTTHGLGAVDAVWAAKQTMIKYLLKQLTTCKILNT